MISSTEENYLKAIYKLQESTGEPAITSVLAQVMGVHPASVTDMLKRLAEKKLGTYRRWKGFTLSEKGKKIALGILRSQRLWQVFLVDKLGFRWDEVHEVAEQLEHIHGEVFLNRLDAFLGHPKAGPHGDPIPDADGVIISSKAVLLSSLKIGDQGILTGVTDDSPGLLQYLDELNISIGTALQIKAIEDFDQSFTICTKSKKEITLSQKAASSLLMS